MNRQQYETTIGFFEPPKGLRRGQWAFNLLHDERPEIADKIRGTAVDPFYRDELLPVFFDRVRQLWPHE